MDATVMVLQREFDRLGKKVVAALHSNPEEFGKRHLLCEFPPPPVVPELPELVLESESGLSLGSPSARSLSLAIPMFDLQLNDSYAWVFGEDWSQSTSDNSRSPKIPSRDFLQILLVEVSAAPSRSLFARLAALRSLAGRVPGYLAHSFQNETNARIHRRLLAAGFSQRHMAQAHLAQARDLGHSGAICVAVGVPSQRALSLFAPFWEEFQALRASCSAGGASSGGKPDPSLADDRCGIRSCQSCDEQNLCDKIRALLSAPFSKTRR